MTSIERILDKGSSYARFRIAILVTQEVLAAAPAPVAATDLERAAGCSSRLLSRVCSDLSDAGILSQAAGVKGAWLPGPTATGVTLADILCSQIGRSSGRRDTSIRDERAGPVVRHNMEAFMLQATISINQTVIEQLRRFPLRTPDANAAAEGKA